MISNEASCRIELLTVPLTRFPARPSSTLAKCERILPYSGLKNRIRRGIVAYLVTSIHLGIVVFRLRHPRACWLRLEERNRVTKEKSDN